MTPSVGRSTSNFGVRFVEISATSSVGVGPISVAIRSSEIVQYLGGNENFYDCNLLLKRAEFKL